MACVCERRGSSELTRAGQHCYGLKKKGALFGFESVSCFFFLFLLSFLFLKFHMFFSGSRTMLYHEAHRRFSFVRRRRIATPLYYTSFLSFFDSLSYFFGMQGRQNQIHASLYGTMSCTYSLLF